MFKFCYIYISQFLKKVSYLYVILRQDAPFIYIYFTTATLSYAFKKTKKQRGTFCVINSAARSAASCLPRFSISLFRLCICFCSAIPNNAFVNPWTVAFSPVCHQTNSNTFLRSNNNQRLYYSETLFTVFFSTSNTSFWSFVCGMSILHPLLRVQSLVHVPPSPSRLSNLLLHPPSVQLACAQFERTFSSFALCPFCLQLFPPLLPFLLGQLGLAETLVPIH